MRLCPGCQKNKVSSGKLVCFACWKLIPRKLGARLYAAWNDGDGYGTNEYEKVVSECLQAIESKAVRA